ncbi:conserved hypothetical protein [Bradyrhizobium sp. ORS 375]|nr:conserved hypothetical protein [Bradyrhizobium sp. ORS 375]
MSATGPLPLACDSDVIASSGYFKISLPPAPSNDGCEILLINGDQSAGKYLIGFPPDVNERLYPTQAVGIVSVGGAWVARSKPGRYKLTPLTRILYVDSNGDDTHDGLTLPLRTFNEAGRVLARDLDFGGLTPVIAPSINQVFDNDPLIVPGGLIGGFIVQISPNGNGRFTWSGPGACVIATDGGWIDLRLNQIVAGGPITQPDGGIDFRCNQSNTPASGHIYIHNNAGIDIEGWPVFYGAGDADNAIFFDGSTYGAASADGIFVDGRFDTVIRLDQGGGRFNIGGVIPYGKSVASVAAKSPAAFVNRLFMVLGASELLIGACPAGSGYRSLGASIVGGNGLIVSRGCPIPGGVLQTQNGKVYSSKW